MEESPERMMEATSRIPLVSVTNEMDISVTDDLSSSLHRRCGQSREAYSFSSLLLPTEDRLIDIGTRKTPEEIALVCYYQLALPFHSYINADLVATRSSKNVLGFIHIYIYTLTAAACLLRQPTHKD